MDAPTAERIDGTFPVNQVSLEEPQFANGGLTYNHWIHSIGVPIYHGFYIEDLRTLELGWWEERGCNTAFIQLVGQEGISEVRVTEIPPGEALPSTCLGVDEMVYVLSGGGVTNIEQRDESNRVFEWRKHSLFLLHHGQRYRHFNAMNEPARLLQYNYLPIAMSAVPDYESLLDYQMSKAATSAKAPVLNAQFGQCLGVPGFPDRPFWYGDFFPDMTAWDQLANQEWRGPGSRVVFFAFPGSEMVSHMAVFPARTYKRAHRHGPGRSIVIPEGEGYSVLWPEGEDKIVVPWHEGTLLTPPDRWFHQHFNTGSAAARYLALHPLRQFHGRSGNVEERNEDQISYSKEDPWIRQKFESELARHGVTSEMSPDTYGAIENLSDIN